MERWTEKEEAAFQQIMEAGRLERLPAIRLYRRFNGDLTRALQVAKEVYGLSDARLAANEKSRPARIAGLVKANENRALKGSIERENPMLQRLETTQAA